MKDVLSVLGGGGVSCSWPFIYLLGEDLHNEHYDLFW